MHAEAVEEEKVKREVEEEMEEEEGTEEEDDEEMKSEMGLQERQTGGEIESPLFILA